MWIGIEPDMSTKCTSHGRHRHRHRHRRQQSVHLSANESQTNNGGNGAKKGRQRTNAKTVRSSGRTWNFAARKNTKLFCTRPQFLRLTSCVDETRDDGACLAYREDGDNIS